VRCDPKGPPGASAVHLCRNMQRLFGPEGPWRTPWMERVLPTIVSIVERVPSKTIFTRFIPPSTADYATACGAPITRDGSCSSADQTHVAVLGLYARRFDLQVELTQANPFSGIGEDSKPRERPPPHCAWPLKASQAGLTLVLKMW
jgi:hypothetical protein